MGPLADYREIEYEGYPKLLEDLRVRKATLIRTGREVTDFTGWTANRTPFLQETNLPGIFCVGDVRYNSIKRVSSSVGRRQHGDRLRALVSLLAA